MGSKKDDPCIGVCQFAERTGWCRGCGRTLAEIRAWAKLTPFRRTALVRELPRRLAKIEAEAAEPGVAAPAASQLPNKVRS